MPTKRGFSGIATRSGCLSAEGFGLVYSPLSAGATRRAAPRAAPAGSQGFGASRDARARDGTLLRLLSACTVPQGPDKKPLLDPRNVS